MSFQDTQQGSVSKAMDESLKEQEQFYNEAWRRELATGKEQRGNLQTNLEFLSQADLLKPGDKILEIGCGIGTVVFELSRQGYDVKGTDISREAISYGRDKYGDIDLEAQPAEILPYDDASYNVVLSFDLFEHIAQVDRHISEVHRVLKEGGYYLFQTPNKYSNVIYETFFHRCPGWRRAHPSLHSPGQLRRRLRRHGFEVRFIKMNPVNEFTNKKLENLGPLARLFGAIDFRKLPLSLQTNLYVVARKSGQVQS